MVSGVLRVGAGVILGYPRVRIRSGILVPASGRYNSITVSVAVRVVLRVQYRGGAGVVVVLRCHTAQSERVGRWGWLFVALLLPACSLGLISGKVWRFS